MLTPHDLAEIRKIVVAAKLIESGAFDAELDKIEEAQRALVEAEQENVRKAEELFQINNKRLDGERAELAKRSQQLDGIAEKLEQARADFEALRAEKEQLFITQGNEADAKLAEAERKMSEANSRMAEADVRAIALDEQEAAVRAGEQALEERLAKLRQV